MTKVNDTTYTADCEFERTGNSTTFEPYCEVTDIQDNIVSDNRCRATMELTNS